MKTFEIVYAPHNGDNCPEWMIVDSVGGYWGRFWDESMAQERLEQLFKWANQNVCEEANA